MMQSRNMTIMGTLLFYIYVSLMLTIYSNKYECILMFLLS